MVGTGSTRGTASAHALHRARWQHAAKGQRSFPSPLLPPCLSPSPPSANFSAGGCLLRCHSFSLHGSLAGSHAANFLLGLFNLLLPSPAGDFVGISVMRNISVPTERMLSVTESKICATYVHLYVEYVVSPIFCKLE